jgi:MFS family permease
VPNQDNSPDTPMANLEDGTVRWYQGISRYQWLVLTIASLGWVFDVFEGQIFVASMRESMPDLIGVEADSPLARSWNDWAFGSFLLGGALGGVFFGILSDRIGRSKTMIYTILFYSVFTCITAFVTAPWQMVVLRFLVAMGVGGEWAVASAMVAEVMPKRSRAVMSSIFHASSVFGTLLAAAAGAFIVGNKSLGEGAWRWGFFIGVLPALLTLWVRWKLKEPEQWVKARARAAEGKTEKAGNLLELFQGANLRSTLVGVTLASIGLVTFWGGHIYGKNALLRHAQTDALIAENVPVAAPPKEAEDDVKAAYKADKNAAFAKHKAKIKRAEMLSMVLNTIGGGLGLILFGSISNLLGRRGAFIFYHVVAFAMMLLMFKVLIPNSSPLVLAITLPVFGFFTLGMHAGYAVYFPELYPTRLRGTGTGFCFNMGRLATAAAFFWFATTDTSPESKAVMLAPLYLVGVVVVMFGRETRGEELAE